MPDSSNAVSAQDTLVRAACPHDCPDTCALLVTVRDGVAISVRGDPDHPTTHGALCAKVSRYTERTYHPDRLLQPMKRVGPKGSGQFAPVSWNEALDDIAERLKEIAARDPQAILPYSYGGTLGFVQSESMAARFFHKLGASLLDRTICSTAGEAGLKAVIGGKMGLDVEQFEHSKLILIWGSNSITSNLHFWTYAQRAKRNGAKLVCIDPWRNDTAEKCHDHVQLRPGTDAALAYALMHELIAHDWLDHDYISQHTVGFAALRERALEWPPERAAEVCGVPAEQIRQLARDYGTLTPAAIRMNYGLQRVRGGANAVRTIACLPALVGAWRHDAGGLLMSSSNHFAANGAALERPDLLAGRAPRTLNMVTIGDDLLRPGSAEFGPKVEAVIVYNSNPLAVAPEGNKVRAGFARDDLFTVVLEHFQTDTADYADYLLPATTQLEHLDVHKAYGHRYWMANNPAIAPLGQAKPNTEIFRLLAARMGYTEPCFAESDEQIAAQAIAPDPRNGGITWEQLRASGWAKLPGAAAPFAHGGFPTPSGKCEFWSQREADAGRDPLPEVLLPYESVASAPELATRYPLAMISPPARNFLNSSFVNVDSLRNLEGEPLLLLHPDDAVARGIADGQMVRTFNDRGATLTRARLSSRTRPGQIVALGIWWRKLSADGNNVNALTHQRLTDLGNGPCFYDCLVEVAAA
ncbi:putative oxidoreductase YoaE [Thiomonas arsenitoxydans]|uniref:Anaerobic dehydrogenase n=1 Tax=Thiomonas arsenitoxydans (strain DSM 22701 / CIP 110005 / 3As) TaxID=426114 RepID=D6CM33_THIA3|nr:molybdopterin oxidoreductase family protein [Thiomonas arsenitoxydans]CQR43507.1 putative oxidoreductase YoaE [Thiomonas sp. CB3]CAZ89611.1 putative anaerobic dehydrogenase [Thiomonas arsenitoxydans]CQR26836.1 putative oxidoreductase YoaE [Thiomonas arsenitoxydans]CQR36462.1 putative oxidoreductase YoaE [Thiomonas arsenitoxydans]CQR38812.1 putative oxidoreductase YoaE [Thiomonas arsenitoxydans]